MRDRSTGQRITHHRQRRADRPIPQAVKPTGRCTVPVWILPVIVGLIAGVVVIGLRNLEYVREGSHTSVGQPTQAALAATAPSVPVEAEPRATADVDADGRVTRIEGKDAQSILNVFCSEGLGHEAKNPLGVRPTEPFRRGVMLGVFVEHGRDYALWIRQHRDTKRWFLGTGLKPIEPEPFGTTPVGLPG